MVRLKFSLKDYSLDIIDDAESTAGISRQITAFRHYILNALRLRMQNALANLEKRGILKTDPKWSNEVQKVLSILDNNRFKLSKCTVKDGAIINEYEFNGDDE